jgi:hypothetical protein
MDEDAKIKERRARVEAVRAKKRAAESKEKEREQPPAHTGTPSLDSCNETAS